MKLMGIEAIYQKPRLSQANSEHKIYPYLLKDLTIDRPNLVWCSDITYIRMVGGFMYLVAIMDWYSRYVLSWELSNTLDSYFCVSALKNALLNHVPTYSNTDQGSQFTSHDYINTLSGHDIKISMDGKGRCMDNIMIERLWRSLKYEDIYINHYETVSDLQKGVSSYFDIYNHDRLHQSLGYKTPFQVFNEGLDKGGDAMLN
jgi:putative transposase